MTRRSLLKGLSPKLQSFFGGDICKTGVTEKTLPRFQSLSRCISSIQMPVIAGLPPTFHAADCFLFDLV